MFTAAQTNNLLHNSAIPTLSSTQEVRDELETISSIGALSVTTELQPNPQCQNQFYRVEFLTRSGEQDLLQVHFSIHSSVKNISQLEKCVLTRQPII